MAKGKGHKGHRSSVKKTYYQKFRQAYEIKKIKRRGKRTKNIATAEARREVAGRRISPTKISQGPEEQPKGVAG